MENIRNYILTSEIVVHMFYYLFQFNLQYTFLHLFYSYLKNSQ